MDPTGGVRESLSHRVGGQVDSLATKKEVLLQKPKSKVSYLKTWGFSSESVVQNPCPAQPHTLDPTH